MERVWNYVHYSIFKAYKLLYKLLSYIDPFKLLYRIPAVKRFYARGGIDDMNKFTDEVAFNDKRSGLWSIWAGSMVGGLLIFFEYGLFNIFQLIIGKSLIQYIWGGSNLYWLVFIAGLLIIPYIVNEQLLFKNDKYLKYFEIFEKEPTKMKRKWTFISFSVILGIVLFFILSFLPLSYIFLTK